MRTKKLFRNKRGFTLVELMVAIAISSIVFGAIYAVFASVNRTCTNNEVTADVMQHMRTSIDFMEQDIRMAGLDPFDSSGAGIELWDNDKLRFTADRNRDGTINAADLSDGIQEVDLERITYEWDSANRRLRQCLSEGTTDDWDTVAENVTAFQFDYFAEDGGVAAALSEIRTVQISMTIEQPAGLSGIVDRTLTKRILCRNLSF
jgi:type IV pilus assembly protein PilW